MRIVLLGRIIAKTYGGATIRITYAFVSNEE